MTGSVPREPDPPASGRPAYWLQAARRPLLKRTNWLELCTFCAVGTSGYVLNLAVYSGLLASGFHFLPAAAASFLVAATSNYTWNRRWTFRRQRGHLYSQGLRFLVVAVVALGANLLLLALLVQLELGKIPAQATAIVLVTPLNFVGNKLWSFGRRCAPRRTPGASR